MLITKIRRSYSSIIRTNFVHRCRGPWNRRNYTYSAAELDTMSLEDWASNFKKETIDVAKMDIGGRSYYQLIQNVDSIIQYNID